MLERKLRRLQQGSYAIIMTRCLKQIVSPAGDVDLALVASIRRWLRPGEEVAVWLVRTLRPSVDPRSLARARFDTFDV